MVAKKLTCAILPVVRAAKVIEFDCNDARRAERKENQCDMLNRQIRRHFRGGPVFRPT